MIKKVMILAGRDEMYLNNLKFYLMENAPQLDLITFTNVDKLNQYLAGDPLVDILVIDETMAGDRINAGTSVEAKILLSGSMVPLDGFEMVKKYQKVGNLLNDILLKYAEKTGTADVIHGEKRTKIVSFYSPAGGTGKTTLALALASASAKSGMRTFYLNLEGIDSVRNILAPTHGTMSDVLLALKAKGMRADIKVAACAGQDVNGGFYYLPGVESISEYEETNGDELKSLVETLRDLGEYDLIVLDIDSGFSSKIHNVLDCSNIIFVPVVSNTAAVAKVRRLLRESELHHMYNKFFVKMHMIINQTNMGGNNQEIENSGIMNELPCCASVGYSKLLTKWEKLIASGEALVPVMKPLFQVIQDN